MDAYATKQKKRSPQCWEYPMLFFLCFPQYKPRIEFVCASEIAQSPKAFSLFLLLLLLLWLLLIGYLIFSKNKSKNKNFLMGQ